MSAGLLVAAAALGYAVALAMLAGAGGTLAQPQPDVDRRRPRARSASLLGQLGLWLYARAEGGVLAPIDYLAEDVRRSCRCELLLAAAVAWWRAR